MESLPPYLSSSSSSSCLVSIHSVQAAAAAAGGGEGGGGTPPHEPNRACSIMRVAACMCLLVGVSLQVDVKSGKAGNFMEDKQWLSTISQYSRKTKHWNRFRDVSGSTRTAATAGSACAHTTHNHILNLT